MWFRKLPRNITKNVQWTMAPKTCEDATSILLVNNSVMKFNELFNMLYDLFYDIDKISYEYETRG